MRFGKVLRENTIKEWRFYSVDYKAMKQSLKTSGNDTVSEEGIAEFNKVFDDSMDKLTKFYVEKETWANCYLNVLEGNLHKLRESASEPPSPTSGAGSTENDSSSVSTGSSLEGEGRDISFEEEKSPKGDYSFLLDTPISSRGKETRSLTQSDFVKEQYRQVGRSTHFHHYYTRRSHCAPLSES